MAIDATDWTIDRATKNIRYVGDDHDGASPTYATVIQFHRWVQGLADDAVASGDDELDITNTNPSQRSTDNIITLINGYNIDYTASQHLYDGTITQDGGDTIYDGIVNFGASTVQIQIHQNGAVIADDFWNFGSGGLNADAAQGISHRFMLLVRSNGADIDGRRLIGVARSFGQTYHEFKINGTSRGNNVLALSDSDDLNNETIAATVASWTTITNTEGLRLIDVNNDGTDEEYYSEWDKAAYTINQFYERMKWASKDPTAEDSNADSGSDFIVDNATITGAAQSFANGSNAMLVTKATVNLKKILLPTGDIIAKIYTHTGTYGSTGTPLAQTGSDSDAVEAGDLTTAYQEITFNFPTPVPLTASTNYFLVIEHADGDASNYVEVEGLASSGTHGGNRAHNTAGWTAVAADDLAFQIYTALSLNGLPGDLFRGITHSFGYDGEVGGIAVSTNDDLVFGTLVDTGAVTGGPFVVGEAIHEDTATPVWKGRVLAVDTVNTSLIIELESSHVVGNSEAFTGQTSGAQATTSIDPTEVTNSGLIRIFAVDDDGATGNLYGQLLKGSSPVNNTRLYVPTDHTDYLDVTDTVEERTVSTPFVGASTGSAIIGAYGFGIESLDLSKDDKLFDLTNTQRVPPNNVTNTVSGLESSEDRVLVGPWDGVSYDAEGNPALDKDQLSLDTALTTDNITQVEVTESIPSDTPSAGYIRVTDDNGFERRLHYQNWENGTPNRFYNIDTTDGNEDFSGDEAAATNDVYIAYIDELAGAGSEAYTAVHTAGTRNLVVLVRDGGATPIKEFIAEWSFIASNQTINAIRTSDA